MELKKGKYKVVVYMQGDEAESDAVYITVGDANRTRVFADPRGSVVAATLYQSDDTFFTATIDKDGPCKIVFTTAEKGAYVDRVVLTKQE